MSEARTILITADDFGWTEGQNQAVERGAVCGVLRRASLLVNGTAFAHAVAMAKRLPMLGVGVHLTLCEGQPLLPAAELGPLCEGRKGAFPDGLGPIFALALSRRLPILAIEREWRAQIERALSAGLVLSHLDGHKHVHLIPPLFSLAIRLCRDYGVPYLRIPDEPPPTLTEVYRETGQRLGRAPAWMVLYSLARRARRVLARENATSDAPIDTADRFVGFWHSGAMTRARLVAAIESAGPGCTEIMLHPAVRTTGMQALSARYKWARQYRFDDEVQALTSIEVREALRRVEGESAGERLTSQGR